MMEMGVVVGAGVVVVVAVGVRVVVVVLAVAGVVIGAEIHNSEECISVGRPRLYDGDGRGGG